jgi:predicted peroxiredoxin
MIAEEYVTEVEVLHWFDIDQQIRQMTAQTPAWNTEVPQATPASRHYVVMLTSGNQDGGKRATLAFSAACAAVALDLDTHVFLIGDGAHWAYEGSCEPVRQRGFPPLINLFDSFTDLGGKVYICSTCDNVCSVPGEDGQATKRRKDVQPRGLAAVLSHMVGGTSVTF